MLTNIKQKLKKLTHRKQNLSKTLPTNSELFDAASKQDWAKIRQLIKNGADVNAKHDGATLYDMAHFNSNTKMIHWLIRHGFNVNAVNFTGMDYLQSEFHDKNWGFAKILIRHGADIHKSMPGKPANSFLHVAVKNQRWDVVALLLKHGFRIDPKDSFIIDLFHQAAHEGQLKVVKLLLKNNVDINAVDSDGRNALHHAIKGHRPNRHATNNLESLSPLPVIKFLISQGINVNAQNLEGETALSSAANQQLGYIVNLLLENNADSNPQDSDGQPILSKKNRDWMTYMRSHPIGDDGLHNFLSFNEKYAHLIYQDDETHTVRNFIEGNWCHVDSRNKEGYTLLYLATSFNKPKPTKILLDYGADINADNYGRTAIQRAVEINNPVILKILAKHASGINPQDANLLMHALIKHQEWQLVRHLARHHADLEGKNENNETLLQLAVRERSWKTVRRLLKGGATLNLPDNEARLLLRHADKKGNTQLAEQLRAHDAKDPMANRLSAATARSSLFHQEKQIKDRTPPERPSISPALLS